MNKVLNNYLVFGFLKIVLNVVLVFICLGILLNLFEEIEFFKNLDVGYNLPFLMTAMFIPNLLIKFLPFVIFIAAMWYFVSIKSSKDLLTLKVFGFSNLKIILILGLTAFAFGVLVIFALNPITSAMIKYYEQTKSNYSRDTDHLVTINRNGVWIKETQQNQLILINAQRLENNFLIDVSLDILSEDHVLLKRIEAKKADVTENLWKLDQSKVYDFTNTVKGKFESVDTIEFNSFYNLVKLNSLYKNLDTISFLDIIIEYRELILRGYEKSTISEKINTFLALPFFLVLMIFLASIFTINNRNINNINYTLIAVLSCAIIYYMKDVSFALGKSNRLSPEMSVWIPIIIISLFNLVGLLQINEK